VLHRWADRSRIRRPVSIPLLVLVTATGTAFAGTTAAETAPLNKPVVAVAIAP
jgi:hypothetical protein